MAIAQKGAISFGLVHIPVTLYTATQDNDIRFNQLVQVGGEMKRVQYKKTCAGCKHEVSQKDIVKGFQYEKDKYVVVTDDDFEKIKTEQDRSIQIRLFTEPGEIPSVYYDKAYQVFVEKGGEKPLELLRRAMADLKKVAIGRTVLGTKETMLALTPSERGLLMQTLHFADEVRELPVAAGSPNVGETELAMAEKLIEAMAGHFEPAAYRDEYQDRLRALIERKIEGKEIVAQKDEAPSNIINLMDALKASLEETTKKTPSRGKKAS